MINYPNGILSFVVRIWVEPREIETAAVVWRGVVELIARSSASPDSADVSPLPHSRAFDDLGTLLAFLALHMEQLGIPPAARPDDH